MSQLLSLGAINKNTGEYVHPKIANKKDEYICPECNKDLILCQGEIRVHHFRHKVDNVNPCHHFSSPTETQIHKDAKILLKTLLEGKMPISFIRSCACCKKNDEYEIPEITESSNIHLEYRFEFNGQKIADVAYIDDNEILCIFEICNTHKTCSENRPEPWFEIYAETLIKLANDSSSQIKIPCIRCEKCDDCIEKELLYSKTKQEIERFKTDVMLVNKLRGYGCSADYKYKYKPIWGYTGDLLEFVINCDMFLSDIITAFENEIINSTERRMFDKCYYYKYHSTIQNMRRYGDNFQMLSQQWDYVDNKMDDCHKQIMNKFIKHYNLINPITLHKTLKIKFSA